MIYWCLPSSGKQQPDGKVVAVLFLQNHLSICVYTHMAAVHRTCKVQKGTHCRVCKADANKFVSSLSVSALPAADTYCLEGVSCLSGSVVVIWDGQFKGPACWASLPIAGLRKDEGPDRCCVLAS